MNDRLFSGIRPTGEIHIGNYLGAIKNWADLQANYESFFCIVDYHAITTPFIPAEMQAKIREMAIGIISCGVDPEKSTLFIQSHVSEHTELSWILSSVTNFNWLTGMIQFKEKSDQHPENINASLFAYPVLQTADIALYNAKKVPVGEDQIQHIELARDVIRKFNFNYTNVLIEPEALITKAKRIMGLDGINKMSKTLNNDISIIDSSDVIFQKLRPAMTDPARVRKTDPGDPEKCNVYLSYHKNFSNEETLGIVREGCTTASIGCIDCKKLLHKGMNEHLEPIREKYNKIALDKNYITDILDYGAKKAKTVASKTLEDVKKSMGLK
ncbi:MAG: tryptophan--tRNA ligase [Candidatus Sericytochromatia bacterium]|nr:tryptophan--tRNA ligase [Candidatus Sericytochromatia bacterium]